MGNLRTKFERFCYKNRNKGIPNLMLWIVLGNALVLVLGLFNGGDNLFSWLCFNKTLILRGQVWRLFTYVFTMYMEPMLGLLLLYFFYSIGRAVEQGMGTFKFNLFYFSGLLLMDVFAMIFSPVVPEVITSQEQFDYLQNTVSMYYNMTYYLHLCMLVTFATLHPDSTILAMMIIPVKGWVLGLIYLLLLSAEIFNMSVPVFYFPHNLFPLVTIGNYLLFFGSDVKNLLPPKWRMVQRKKSVSKRPAEPIQFRPTQRPAPKKEDFNHKCTVCGRTDVTNPELEFRYCSRCNGYHCYCQDHINDHTHI